MHLVNQFVLLFLCLCCTTQAQKKPVSNESYLTWLYLYPDYNISNNGKFIWYRYGAPAIGDTLVLQSDTIQKFAKGFQPVFTEDNLWLIFRLPGDLLIMQSTTDMLRKTIPHVINYTLVGSSLILQTTTALIYQDKIIQTGIADTYTSNIPDNISDKISDNTFDKITGNISDRTLEQTQLAFIINNTLRYYHSGMDSAISLLQNACGPIRFSKDGSQLYFQRILTTETPQKKDVHIWHYNDYYLPTQQLPIRNANMVINLSTKEVFRLDSSGTEICDYGNKYVLAQNTINANEYYWNKSIISTLYLVKNGVYKTIRQNKTTPIIHAKFSPDEKFITWYEDQYYNYEIATGIIKQDPQPVEKVHILSSTTIFSTTSSGITISDTTTTSITTTSITTTFNTHNKYNNDSPYLYYYPQYPLDQYKPVKARDTNIYLIQRMSDKESPNLFTTSDFKTYTRITNIHPEQSYNWLQATLVKNGILYKPENFDPLKKYPLIFHYYEISSNRLYLFKKPALSIGDLDIARYVSNGYLVFIPDIKRPKGHPGKGAMAVIRAAKYFRRKPWVDKTKLGLQGHSFGGYITNYLITHSNLFAAAQESAGPVDFISGYGAVKKQTGNTMQYLYERGQNNIGATPWQRRDLYIKNSPIFRIDKINTPLLILHNEQDNSVPVEQGISLFTALRRLQKPVWLLQYSGEGHMLINEQHKLDFSRRQQQFFDHYLKGMPAPDWMTDH